MGLRDVRGIRTVLQAWSEDGFRGLAHLAHDTVIKLQGGSALREMRQERPLLNARYDEARRRRTVTEAER